MPLLGTAKKLIAQGEPDEARRVLLDAASGPTPDAQARHAFEELFPLSSTQRKWMSATLMNLVAKDAAARAKAAKEVLRTSAKEVSNEQQELIGDPRCLDYLIPAMQSEDAKVAEAATAAVAQAACFYFRDPRACEPASRLLTAKKPAVRYRAAEAVAYLGRESAVDTFLPLFADPAENVRDQAAAGLIWMARSGHLSPATRRRLASDLGRRMTDFEAGTRQSVIGVIREMNDKAGIEPLRAALKNEKDESLRDYIHHAIRCLEAGDPSLPM